MTRGVLSIVSLCCLFSVGYASVCVVSFWSEWNSCVGNCQFALRVRNRNVIRPPFPERTPDGRLAIRPCPSLYQVQTCIPTPCLSASQNTSAANSVESSIDAEAISVHKVVEEAPEPARIEKLPPHEAESTSSNDSDLPKPLSENVETSTQPKITISDGVSIINEVGDEHRVNQQTQPPQQLIVGSSVGGKASVVEMKVGSSTSPTVSIAVAATEPSVLSTGKLLPQSTETAVTVDVKDPEPVKPEEPATFPEATSSSAIVGNINAHSDVSIDDNSNATLVETNQTVEIAPIVGANVSPSTKQSAVTQNSLAVSTVAPEIDNSEANETEPEIRRSPLPGKAILRNTKPCGIEGGNPRCCRQPPRAQCPNGEKPQSVMRWSRMADNEECQSYNYGYCGIDVELDEAPIKFEQNCYDLCFTEDEKDTLGIFRDSQFQFRDGFRVRL